MRLSLIMIALALLIGPALGANTPCSKKKGGIVGCVGTKFLCRDGSTSASKKTCTRDQAEASDAIDEGELIPFTVEQRGRPSSR